MNQTLINIVLGIIANIVSTLLLILAGWIIYFFSERRLHLNFFNISSTKRIVIYLSNLRIVQGGSIGPDGMHRNYQGTAVVYTEQIAANKFKDSFNFLAHSFSKSPSYLSKILFSDINVASIPSPLTNDEIESNCTIISFGSPGYNLVSKKIEEYAESQIRMANNNTEIDIDNIPIITFIDAGFIQRIIKNTNGIQKSAFYVAGLSERGTVGAANYLAKNWKQLNKKFKNDESFIVLLRFPSSNIDEFSLIIERKIE